MEAIAQNQFPKKKYYTGLLKFRPQNIKLLDVVAAGITNIPNGNVRAPKFKPWIQDFNSKLAMSSWLNGVTNYSTLKSYILITWKACAHYFLMMILLTTVPLRRSIAVGRLYVYSVLICPMRNLLC